MRYVASENALNECIGLIASIDPSHHHCISSDEKTKKRQMKVMRVVEYYREE